MSQVTRYCQGLHPACMYLEYERQKPNYNSYQAQNAIKVRLLNANDFCNNASWGFSKGVLFISIYTIHLDPWLYYLSYSHYFYTTSSNVSSWSLYVHINLFKSADFYLGRSFRNHNPKQTQNWTTRQDILHTTSSDLPCLTQSTSLHLEEVSQHPYIYYIHLYYSTSLLPHSSSLLYTPRFNLVTLLWNQRQSSIA